MWFQGLKLSTGGTTMLRPVGDLDISKVVSTTNDTEMANVATSEIQHNHSDLPSPPGKGMVNA